MTLTTIHWKKDVNADMNSIYLCHVDWECSYSCSYIRWHVPFIEACQTYQIVHTVLISAFNKLYLKFWPLGGSGTTCKYNIGTASPAAVDFFHCCCCCWGEQWNWRETVKVWVVKRNQWTQRKCSAKILCRAKGNCMGRYDPLWQPQSHYKYSCICLYWLVQL